MRKNVVTGELVIIAPERAARPHDHVVSEDSTPAWSKSCPFCPGNEDRTPPATYVTPSPEAWVVRAVPNKFSALAPEGAAWSTREGLYPRGAAAGPHEVIIEGQNHDGRFWEMSTAARRQVVGAWHHRMRAFHARSSVQHVVLFKNHGVAAGSSLTHPHSQIVGLPEVPGRFEHRRMLALAHRRAQGGCLLCDVVAAERADGVRQVAENSEFVAFVPFAAFSPLHVWICPKRHSTSFGQCSEEELDGLEALLTSVLRAIDVVGPRPDFNLVFLGGHPGEAEDEAFHWYLSIVGRTTKAAGFELGSGMYINPSSPELQAEKLRKAVDSTSAG